MAKTPSTRVQIGSYLGGGTAELDLNPARGQNRPSYYVIIGSADSGKAVLADAIAAQYKAKGGRVTTIRESHFYDRSKLVYDLQAAVGELEEAGGGLLVVDVPVSGDQELTSTLTNLARYSRSSGVTILLATQVIRSDQAEGLLQEARQIVFLQAGYREDYKSILKGLDVGLADWPATWLTKCGGGHENGKVVPPAGVLVTPAQSPDGRTTARRIRLFPTE